jgi:hypothetical protein
MPLHYGAEYIVQSIHSFIDLVGSFHVLYSEKPSYGHGSVLKCPDSRELLYEKCKAAAGSKLVWHDISATSEGEHRGISQNILNGCDVLFTSDADEVWYTEELDIAIEQVYNDREFSRFGVNGKVDLWRSFEWVMRDGFQPVRFIKKGNKPQGTIDAPYAHFGYAQSAKYIEYKMDIHGHKAEIIDVHGSVDAYVKKVLDWTPESNDWGFYHPASKDVWNQAEEFDKAMLPHIMRIHPNYEKELI